MRGSAHHLLNWLPVQRCLPAGPHSQPQGQMPGAQQPAPSSRHDPEPSTLLPSDIGRCAPYLVLTRAAPGDKAEGTGRGGFLRPQLWGLGDNVHMSNQVLKRYTDTKERHF